MTRSTNDNQRLYTPNSAMATTWPKFRATLAGETRVKPKFIISPNGKTLHRLVLPEHGEQPFYEEMPLNSEVIYSMQLSDEAKEACAQTPLPELPPPYSMRNFKFHTRTPHNYPDIRVSQLHTVLTALGRPYGWSLSELASGSPLPPLVIHMLYKDDKIVGMCGWNKSLVNRRKDKAAGITFYLISPDERGQGLGKYLLTFSQQQMIAAGVGTIMLSTSDSCTDKNDVCVTQFYKRQGYDLTREYFFDYEHFAEAAELPVTVPERCFRHPATGEELPRFQKARLDSQLARVSKELLSQGHAR